MLLVLGGILFFGSWASSVGENPSDAFLTYLDVSYPVADGFDFPVGDKDARGSYRDLRTGKVHRGWYKATRFGERTVLGIHPGEDWNGRGGRNTDYGQPVYAIGVGVVVSAKMEEAPWGGVVVVEHTYYENHHKRRIRSQYAHLSGIDVAAGQDVARRQQLGRIGRDPDGRYFAHLHFEVRRDPMLAPTYWPETEKRSLAWVRDHYINPTRFIRSHRSLFVPGQEETLVLVEEEGHRARIFKKGKLQRELEVGFGQSPGRKRIQGDLKTPKGMYFVVSKYKGAFTGRYGAYYGGHWIKINYPNRYDADFGVAQGIISKAQQKRIGRRWRKRRLTSQKTKLGGGIGFHGWIGPWSLEDGARLSWGCVVMHNRDIRRVYDDIPVGAMVVLQ